MTEHVPAGVPPVRGNTGDTPMSEDRFWGLITAARQEMQGRHVLPDAAVELAVLTLPGEERAAFDALLAEKKWALPYHHVHGHLAPEGRFSMDDRFQYTLTALVLLGQETFAELLRSPEETLSRVMPGIALEGRLFVPYGVWLREVDQIAQEERQRRGWAPGSGTIMQRYAGWAETVENAKGGQAGVLVWPGWQQGLRVEKTA